MSGANIVGTGATAAGLTFFGVATGLDPALLMAGFAGGAWAQSYNSSMPLLRRLSLSVLASILAAYSAPVLMALAPDTISPQAVKLLAAVLVGFTSHRVLGPALLRFVSKKAEDLSK